MNTEISSKLSLYDILAMFIPGALLLVWINSVVLGKSLVIDITQINPWIASVLVFAGSYLIGIIYCRLIEWLWVCILAIFLTSTTCYIIFSILRYYTIYHEMSYQGIICSIICITTSLCIILCLCLSKKKKTDIFHCFDCFHLLLRNSPRIIKYLFVEIYKELPTQRLKEYVSRINKGNKYVIDAYYEAYTFVAKNTYRNDIHILESQFAFLRSMFGIIMIYFLSMICFCWSFNDTICNFIDSFEKEIISFFILILISILIAMGLTQKKIYHIVWEDYEYFHRVKDDK